MSSPCAKHPVLHPVVGVCASCLEEKLVTCVSNLKANGEEEEEEEEEFSRSSIIVNKGNLNSSPRRPLSFYLEDQRGVYSNCKDNSRHKKYISCDGVYEESSFYSSHYYARKERKQLRGEGEKESPLFEEGRLSQRKGGSKESALCEKGRPPSSWLSAFFSKRGGKQKANCREGSIAPWRECESGKYEGASHHYGGSITWDAPRPSSWEQLSSWEKPSSSPLKLAPLLSSYSPSSPLKLHPHIISQSSTSSPLKLPPLLSSQSSTRPPLKLPPLLGSQSTKSSLKLAPLLSNQPPLSPLKLPSLLGSQPTISSDVCAQVCTVSSRIETNQRSGHSSSVAQPKKTSVWFRVLLRNRWTVRFKRHFAKKERQEEADSARTSSAKESDYHRHSQNHCSVHAHRSQNHCLKEKAHYQNQQFSILNRPSRAGSVSGRDYGAWESYYSPVHSHSFNGVQARHRYNSLSCVQRGEGAELLRLYLAPVRGPSFRSKIRSC